MPIGPGQLAVFDPAHVGDYGRLAITYNGLACYLCDSILTVRAYAAVQSADGAHWLDMARTVNPAHRPDLPSAVMGPVERMLN